MTSLTHTINHTPRNSLLNTMIKKAFSHKKENIESINHKPLTFKSTVTTHNINITRKFDFKPVLCEKKIDYDRVLTFDRTFEKYLKEIESITDRRLHPTQYKQIKYHLDNYEYTRLTPDESHQHRKEFSHNKKDIINEWEKMTNCTWPTYDKPVYNSSGKVIRQAGNKYDAHEIIENSWGGPHYGWNIHPARFPDEHQQGIHRKGGIADKIFN